MNPKKKKKKKRCTLERLKRPDVPFIVCSAQGSKFTSLMIDSTISTACFLCIRRWPTDGPLGDGTYRRHQTFTSSMAGFGRRRLLLLVAHRDNQSFLKRTIILPFRFPIGCPFLDDLMGRWGRSLLLLFFTCHGWHPHQRSLFGCLHFCKGQMTRVR